VSAVLGFHRLVLGQHLSSRARVSGLHDSSFFVTYIAVMYKVCIVISILLVLYAPL